MQRVGIASENEFYSDHYLSEIFSGDIRDVLAAWQERETSEREQAKSRGQGGSKYEGYRSPPNVLNAMAHGLMQRIDEIARTRAPEERPPPDPSPLRRTPVSLFSLYRTWPRV